MLVMTLPESPKYLYVNRKFDQARHNLKKIARYNGSELRAADIDLLVFDTEDTGRESLKGKPDTINAHYDGLDL